MDTLLFYKADAVKEGYGDEGLFKVFAAVYDYEETEKINISFMMPDYSCDVYVVIETESTGPSEP